MGLCLANSLVARRDFIPYDQLVRYKWWFRYGYMSSTGHCFDNSSAFSQSLKEFERRQQLFARKHKIPSDELDFLSDPHLLKEFDVHCTESGVAGNEALIRLTPVSLFFYRYPTDAVEFAGISGAITHDSPKAYDSCRYYGALIVAALRGETKQQLLDDKFYLNHKSWFNNKPLNPDVMKVAQGSYKKAGEYHDRIRGKGYIVDALETALWTFYYDEGSFEKGILDAVNRGDDTDATAAIYGPLAGAYYGFDNLPKKWISQMLLFLLLLAFSLSKVWSIEFEPYSLRTQSLYEPLGIDAKVPLLSWRLQSSKIIRGVSQVAYQIRAAHHKRDLDSNPLWDSGMVVSNSTAIVWEGPTLSSRERIVWQVRSWDNGGKISEWSEIASFEMGLLDAHDWDPAVWIENKAYMTGNTSLPYFVKRFSISNSISSARLWIVGLGQFVATVNGQVVTSGVLNPGYFDWNKSIEYSTYNVTALLKDGDNVLGVALGKGIYRAEKPLGGRYYKFLTTPHPMKLIAQLQLNYMDGSCQYIVSDSSWLTTVTGPLLESSWYGGEEYDARKELIGWDTPTYDHSTWKMADISSIPNPNAIYRARESPSIQIVEEIVAISVTDKGDGTYIFDFGINHAGWPKLSMRGARGTTVTIMPGELLNLDETINQVTEGTPIYDRYTFSGNGIETYAPTFRYHGFRYLQIENLTYLPQVNDFKSYTLRINNDVTGTFNSSIELLNSIHKIVNRAVQSNMFSVFTDCPHREKLGWLEETHLVFPAIERFFDVQAHGRSVVRRIAEAQLSNGMVPTTAPEFPIFNGAFRDEPNWGNSIILLPLYLYQSYGEIALLEEFYSNMVSWIDYLRSKAQNNIVSYGLGDWYAIDQSTPVGVTGTYGYWMSANGLEKIASALNKTDDAKKYSDLASQISSAFHRTYFNATAHTYATGSQAADVFALEMGAVPVTEQQNVIQHLINDIRERSNHTSSGEVSLPSWFRMLSFYGHDDVIYDFLSRTDSPSYGYAIIHGATSLTEDWDGPAPAKGQPLSSQNHFMFGAVDEWFMRSLAGIQQVANSIDYRILNIKPVIVGNISHVEATYRTTRGWIEIQWNRVEEVFTLKVMLPYGSIAKVYVPGTKATSDYGTQIQIRKREAMTVFKIESGSYTFKSVIDVNTKQN
ncbi:unnamed protein product [Rotaria sp. Silwood1]|nr:unnamed protein product [Rotaria sp. Silwood1]CAF1516563.1 unnamed protein product [Rotaria sp. Silwood1]